MSNIEIDTESNCLKKGDISIYYDSDFILYDSFFGNRVSTSLSLNTHLFYIPRNGDIIDIMFLNSNSINAANAANATNKIVIMDIELLFDFFIYINRFLINKLSNVKMNDKKFYSLPRSTNVSFGLTYIENVISMNIITDIGPSRINVDITDFNRLYKIMDTYPGVFKDTHFQFIE